MIRSIMCREEIVEQCSSGDIILVEVNINAVAATGREHATVPNHFGIIPIDWCINQGDPSTLRGQDASGAREPFLIKRPGCGLGVFDDGIIRAEKRPSRTRCKSVWQMHTKLLSLR
jgi:hypothetical protein